MNSSSHLLKSTLLSFFFCSLLITVCYTWLDPIIALWVNQHHNFNEFLFFEYFTYIANLTVWATALYYLYFSVIFAARKENPSSFQLPFLNIANSVALSIFMKDALKFVFGRYWPNTWNNNNISLIHDHAYGFHFFHSGVPYQSFPSGHTTIVVAAATSIWITYPRGPWRYLALLAALLTIIGLLAKNYHFLGDCIAGAWVGFTVASYVTTYSRESALIKRD